MAGLACSKFERAWLRFAGPELSFKRNWNQGRAAIPSISHLFALNFSGFGSADHMFHLSLAQSYHIFLRAKLPLAHSYSQTISVNLYAGLCGEVFVQSKGNAIKHKAPVLLFSISCVLVLCEEILIPQVPWLKGMSDKQRNSCYQDPYSCALDLSARTTAC